MQMIALYKYERDGGGITVSPEKPDKTYTLMYRLVADEGKILTNGETMTPCIDVDGTDGWDEIDAPDDKR